MKIRLDENLGFMAGIVTVVIVGKLWMPHLGYFEILWGVMKGLIGW